MVFKRMLGALGVGGPSVDTVLATPRVRPGETLAGEVRVKGGDFPSDIEYISLGLVARVEIESGDAEHTGTAEFFSARVSGPFRLGQGEQHAIPFQLPVPWETPVTEIGGARPHGAFVGVRTELAVAKAIDKGDLDQVSIVPLPSQDEVLRGFAALGFHLKSADLEAGRIYGVDQRLPFYQEIEFYPPAQWAGRINEVELTFVADPYGLTVVLEADKRARLFQPGSDAIGRFQVTHEQAARTDWASEIGRWLDSVAHGHGGHHAPGPYGHQGSYGHGEHGYGHPGQHGHGGHGGHGGPGWGAVAAAGAAGVVGGMIAGEVIDEIGDMFEGDGGDEGGGDW
ncbi:sporulation protein [Sphaerisporangium melleum]|uniref:Sporulation protein n=1 Tax=Sphaerisporangium melleum TaxID=321316 RepID=A0A917RGS2_9ACTN|nr:sporulation protein [Sphaerisporangium melleum]GGL07323.1 sporulation protein [Sphaerisporangium melleum]GII68705.1 sporulation protein [Sphaerisporangium melleum]